MAGLINTAVDKNNPFKTVGYDPEIREINADTDTVEGRASKLVAGDSPFMTQARTRATQNANARGLINSSMAAQAGEEAAFGAALPIAAADAQIYNTQGQLNQQSKNRALEFSAGSANTLNQQNLQGIQQKELASLQGSIEGDLIGKRGTQDRLNIGATGEQQRQTQAAGGEIQSQLSAQQAAQQKAQTQLQAEMEKGLITTREQADARLRQLTGEIEKGLVTARTEGESRLQTERAGLEGGLLAKKAAFDKAIQELKGSQDLAMQGLRGEQANHLAQIEGTYRGILQASSAATAMYSNLIRNISEAMNNADLDPANKQLAIDRSIDMLESGLTVIGGIADLDLTSLLSF